MFTIRRLDPSCIKGRVTSDRAFILYPANAQGEHSPGATAEGDMLDPVVVADFAPKTPSKKVEKK